MGPTSVFQRVMITGPSGVGKSTIASQLVARAGFVSLRSHTTRPHRPNEPSTAYFFVTPEEFEATPMVEQMRYHGNRYGLSRSALEKTCQSSDVVHVASPDTFERYHPLGFKSIYLLAPSEAELLRRLMERDGHHNRGELALAEHRASPVASASADVIVVNDMLEDAVAEVLEQVAKWRTETSKLQKP